MAGDYEIKDIYQGGYSSFEPSYGNIFTNYMVDTGKIGMATDPRTANVLKEISEQMASGAKTIELEMVSPEVAESIPKQHLKEVNRLSKLTGVDVTVHGPVVEASGLTQQGWSETNREAIERQMNMTVERGHEVNPDGSSPVTFHSSAILPASEITKTKEGEKIQSSLVINSETGDVRQIKLRERHFPGEEEQNIQRELQKINEDSWRGSLSHLAYNTERAAELIRAYGPTDVLAEAEKKEGKELTPEKRQAMMAFNAGTAFLNDSYRELKELCDIAYKNGAENEKKIVKDFYNEIQPKVEQIQKQPYDKESVKLREEIVEKGLEVLNPLLIPQTFKPLDEFSQDKSTTTFANVAFNSYKKFGSKAPIISIENPPAGGAFARGEELKNIVEESRKKFVEKAVKEGMSKSEAKRQAEKLIGVTWDVGHINMLRKYGFTEKDIIKETEKIAPLTKHVHLSDNFGFEHTELPMGMGNVPIDKIMKKLGKKGYEAKKIIEAAQWWQHFSPGGKQNPPFKPTLQAMGSPIYSMDMAPYWNQSLGLQQDYSSSYGLFLPQVHYETFGAGFAQLPTELGGQRAGGEGARMSGRPME